jgi:nitrite reductase/ring-hydroxylating ferredoxin subunit
MSRMVQVPLDEWGDLDRKMIRIDDQELLILKENGRYYAVSNICPHARGRLESGRIEQGAITCLHHGASFDLESGALRFDLIDEDLAELIDEEHPPFGPLATFPVERVGDVLRLTLP